jgi:ABC-type transport system involved in multi-copper enzyme maturation permease subunit
MMSLFRSNPVLNREVGVRLRFARYSKANKVAVYSTLFGLLPMVYFLTLRLLFTSTSTHTGRDFYALWMLLIELTTALLLPAALTASTITGEREKQTWNALLLSRLGDAQIVLGKLMGALVPPAILFGLFFPVNVLAAYVAEVSVSKFLIAHGVILITALLSASLGLLCSWAFRRTQIALVTTVIGLLILTLGSPLIYILAQMTTRYSTIKSEMFVPLWLNPYYILHSLVDAPHRLSVGEVDTMAAPTNTYLMAASLVIAMMLFTVVKRLKLGPEELTH